VRLSRLQLVLAVAGVGAAFAMAFTVAAATAFQPLTGNEVDREGMNFEEIAAAASGRPGEIAPPRPDEGTANPS
jgi:hypothetical protein